MPTAGDGPDGAAACAAAAASDAEDGARPAAALLALWLSRLESAAIGADDARNGEERGSDGRDPNRSPAATIVQLDCWPYSGGRRGSTSWQP